MINYQVEESFIEHYSNFLEKEKGFSRNDFLKHIKDPEFSQALCYFVIDIVESDLYRELFGEATHSKLLKDDKYGYHELQYTIDNKISEESHSFQINMKHLYSYSEYGEEEPAINDIGKFKETDVELNTKENSKVLKFYNDLNKANENNLYVKTFKETKNAEELLEKSDFISYNQEDNPFSGLGEYSNCIGLNYLDTTRPYLGKDVKHRAISCESPIGPIAYLHFKGSYNEKDSDNTFFLSSIGVIPSLRQKGLSKKMYELANEKLDFNKETIIYRTQSGDLAPKEFKDKVPLIVKDHKALYLHHKLSELNYDNIIEGFSDISRKEQMSFLKKINNDFNDAYKNKTFLNSGVEYKLLIDFKEKTEKDIKNKILKRTSKTPCLN
jgi:hypothetical protein